VIESCSTVAIDTQTKYGTWAAASPEARAAAHAALRATAALGRSRVATTARRVTADDAQELGEFRAFAVRALGLLIPAHE
jgi:hypothetical protein